MKLAFKILPARYAIVQLPPDAAIPPWATEGPIFSITRTPDELSIVCEENLAPEGVRGWRCIEVVGPFPLTAVGVAAEFTSVFARREISVLVISSYNTDYILLNDDSIDRAVDALIEAGHVVRR